MNGPDLEQIRESRQTRSIERMLRTDEIRHEINLSKPKPPKRKKKANNPPMNKQKYLEFRRDHGWDSMCDSGAMTIGNDMHHCFIGRKKGYPILDDYRNIVLVNHWLHEQRKFDNKNWRKYFWLLQCKRFGSAAMQEWIDAVLASGLDASRLDFLR